MCYWLHRSLLTDCFNIISHGNELWSLDCSFGVEDASVQLLVCERNRVCMRVRARGCVLSVWPRRTYRLTMKISETPLATVFPWECSLKRCISSNGGGQTFFPGKGDWGHKNNRVWEKTIKWSSGGPWGWVESYCEAWSLHTNQPERRCTFIGHLNVHTNKTASSCSGNMGNGMLRRWINSDMEKERQESQKKKWTRTN